MVSLASQTHETPPHSFRHCVLSYYYYDYASASEIRYNYTCGTSLPTKGQARMVILWPQEMPPEQIVIQHFAWKGALG